MSKIIFTADDYGAIDGIDDGIIDAVRNSPIKSVASFANSPDAARRLQRLKDLKEEVPELEIGCHFTLTSGSPVLSQQEVPTLYDDDPDNVGNFRDFGDFQYDMTETEVENELRAQMDVFAAQGIEIEHLTSHHNSLDYFEKFHRIFMKLAHEYYPGRVIPTRSPNVEPGLKGMLFREIVKVKMEDDNDDRELELFSNFGNRITSVEKVERLMADYGYNDVRMPLFINSIHYGFPDKKKKSRRAIERKYPKRRKKLLKDIGKLDESVRPYEYVCHLIADDYDRFDEFVNQLVTQDYGSGVDEKYFDGRMIELKSIKGVTTQDLTEVGAELSSWGAI